MERERLKEQYFKKSDFTFKPKIESQAKRSCQRSFYEMSRGDQLRKETNLRMARMRLEREQLADVTFKPQLNTNSVSKKVEGHLRIISEPETYASRLEAIQRQREQKHLMNRSLSEKFETADCTFTPKIYRCPAYVKRIAAFRAEMKLIREAEALNASRSMRPSWK
mmetsp:Transcript_19115/g.28191  ORF Transcript_19115/g.28191 Transcript_19115/m.28191 type:complete len:166 (-) Transcript_19115:47-544(-)